MTVGDAVLVAALADATGRVLIVCNPNSPSGTFTPVDAIEEPRDRQDGRRERRDLGDVRRCDHRRAASGRSRPSAVVLSAIGLVSPYPFAASREAFAVARVFAGSLP